MLTGMYGLFCGVWAKQGGWRTLGVRNCSTSVCMKLLPCLRGTCHKGDIQKLKLLWDKVSRASPRRLHKAIHLPSRNWIYVDTGFYSGQTSHLNMKVLTFAKDENMRFLLNPC